jgi:dihydrofolate reductase
VYDGDVEIIGIAAISLDGLITRHAEEGTGFASPEDGQFFRQALQTFDCSLMGRRTYEVSRERILGGLSSERLRIVRTRHPETFAADAVRERLEFTSALLSDVLDNLEARGKQRCAVLGGTRVYSECLEQDWMDELWLTVEPLGFGRGKRLLEGDLDIRFNLKSIEHLSQDTLLLKYAVLKGESR